MIIAGSPETPCRTIAARARYAPDEPVIIDIFPTGRESHYSGDLTRTVVVGEPSEEVRRMHQATLQALDAAIESINAGVPAGDVHNAACRSSRRPRFRHDDAGFEGPRAWPR